MVMVLFISVKIELEFFSDHSIYFNSQVLKSILKFSAIKSKSEFVEIQGV
jgi:hypothetical protein